MSATNFDLAPPAATVDGLLAVPIDIQRITASLTFDGATSAGSGDATLDFVVGPGGGNPIFDLRQTITGLWLDGAAIPPAQAAHHDFGGGTDAELRVVESVLAAGSSHSLRVAYTLGPPQASGAGSYQPAITWTAGPRLAFNFGFTDLGAGRYLEAWIPANLVFDQFELVIELALLNTPVAHTVITNGGLTTLGPNHWRVSFPDRCTALSPLLELRAADTVSSLIDTTILPVSGASVTIETWKLAGNPVHLPTQMANLKGWLAANEASTGPYLHGGRFVAFLNVGGMEYDGGTTTNTGALQHEAFHSWFGRGLKPASQVDGWWDEAWTVYNVLGATGATPLDFVGDPPVELCSRNPWRRVTPLASYSSGKLLFEGLASFIGVAGLRTHMAAFYAERNGRPATTPDLEAFLVCRSGEARIVDAFHRFVYGFADQSPAPDLWLKDDPGDTGATPWAGRFWDSPDLWIRNADDGGTTHQPVESGQDNWFYARVRNRSAAAVARHFLVTFNVEPWAGTQFVYPGDFFPCIAAAPGFDLGPGESTIVKARWPAALVPPAGTHACWLAAVVTRSNHPGVGAHVWEHNNLAQKNLAVVDLAPGDRFVLPFVVDRLALRRARKATLELVRPRQWPDFEAVLLHKSRGAFAVGPGDDVDIVAPSHPPREYDASAVDVLDCGADDVRSARATDRFEWAFAAKFPIENATLPVWLRGAGQTVMGLRLGVPADAKPGDTARLDLVQRTGPTGRITGGLAVEIRVKGG